MSKIAPYGEPSNIKVKPGPVPSSGPLTSQTNKVGITEEEDWFNRKPVPNPSQLKNKVVPVTVDSSLPQQEWAAKPEKKEEKPWKSATKNDNYFTKKAPLNSDSDSERKEELNSYSRQRQPIPPATEIPNSKSPKIKRLLESSNLIKSKSAPSIVDSTASTPDSTASTPDSAASAVIQDAPVNTEAAAQDAPAQEAVTETTEPESVNTAPVDSIQEEAPIYSAPESAQDADSIPPEPAPVNTTETTDSAQDAPVNTAAQEAASIPPEAASIPPEPTQEASSIPTEPPIGQIGQIVFKEEDNLPPPPPSNENISIAPPIPPPPDQVQDQAQAEGTIEFITQPVTSYMYNNNEFKAATYSDIFKFNLNKELDQPNYILGKIVGLIHKNKETKLAVTINIEKNTFEKIFFLDNVVDHAVDNITVGGGSDKKQQVLESYKKENIMLVQLLEKSKKLIGDLVDVIQHKQIHRQ